MPRRAKEVICTQEELDQLHKLIKGKKTEKRIYERAKIILRCNDRKQNKDIAKELKTTVSTIAKWRKRFIKDGLRGLIDEKRSGKPKKYGEEVRNNILKVLEGSPPKGQKSWDGESVAKRLGISKYIVWKILKKEGIQLQRTRSWCVSTDKEFAAKSADIIGLYLNPPEKAIVLCVDEKPSIQAIERKTGYVETSSGKIVRGLKSTYRRNGTLNLFAALNVATGAIKTEITKTKTRIDFQSFLNNILSTTPKEKEIHIILDNYCTHKRNDVWLQKYPNVHFHYTPTSASWLNQVEIWFGILTRKALRGGSFSSTQHLKKAIEEFVEVYHENAKPFIWRKREVRGAQLKNTIMNLRN